MVGKKYQNGGGSLWRNLGLKFPVDLYHDSQDFLYNVKHQFLGDRQDSTSTVTDQPIAKRTINPAKPSDYSKAFIDADKIVSDKMKSMSV